MEMDKMIDANPSFNQTGNNATNQGRAENKNAEGTEVKKKSKKVKKEGSNNKASEKQKPKAKTDMKKEGEKAPNSSNISASNATMSYRHIFAVSGASKPSINALKCDSSDDENNVIIQENDNINMNNINYNEEDGFNEEDI